MKNLTPLFGTTALCVVLGAPAFADITPQDVWSFMKASNSAQGGEITATETESGNSLVLTDITSVTNMEVAGETLKTTATMMDITLQDMGDGRVSFTIPASSKMSSTSNAHGHDITHSFVISQEGLKVIASGTPDQIAYETSADKLTFATDGPIKDEMNGSDVTASVSFIDLKSDMENTKGAIISGKQTMTASEMTYAMTVKEGTQNMDVTGGLKNINVKAIADMPVNENATANPLAFLGTMGADMTFTGNSGNMHLVGTTEDGMPIDMKTTSQSIDVKFTAVDGVFGYHVSQKGLDVNASGGGAPFPLTAKLGEMAFDLKMPIAKGEGEKDLQLGIAMRDLELPEMLLNMVDPGLTLPRDPITVDLQASGKGMMMVDFADLESMETDPKPPFQVSSANLDRLLISVAGAKLTGEGAFTFDNTNPMVPQPVGAVDLKLEGANTLMDKLVVLGLLPQEQAMGARMMMGMFARPGEGEDTLTSKIEMTKEGQVIANGQRLN